MCLIKQPLQAGEWRRGFMLALAVSRYDCYRISVMRRFIAKSLILFVMFAGIAWAADLNEIALSSGAHATASVAGAVDGQPVPNPINGKVPLGSACDHCCHGAGHYVGFPSTPFFVVPIARDRAPMIACAAHSNRIKEPPLQPPKI